MKAIIKDYIGNKAEKSEVSSLIFGFLGIIFIAVGFIEVSIYSTGFVNFSSFR